MNFNSFRPSDAYMRQWTRPSLLQIMACRLMIDARLLSEPKLVYVNFTLRDKHQCHFNRNAYISFKIMKLKMSSAKWWPLCFGNNVLTHRGWNRMSSIFMRHFRIRFTKRCSVWGNVFPKKSFQNLNSSFHIHVYSLDYGGNSLNRNKF